MMDRSETSLSAKGTPAEGVGRRRLIRAGLSAAPVLAALKTNSVLAGDHTCIRPSTFSSLTAAHMKVSRGRTINADFECRSHVQWRTRTTGLTPGFKENTKFVSSITGFADRGGAYDKMTLQQVLELRGGKPDAALARHVTAAFLTATAFNNNRNRVLLTKSQCATIWNQRGVWTPFAGTTWNQNQTLAYFEMIHGPAFL